MIVKQRGRGKFKPSIDIPENEVRNLLMKKISEEIDEFSNTSHSIDISKLQYNKDKLNVISLFSGCGGLDLGFELAGLEYLIGKKEAQDIFKDKQLYNETRHKSIFHTILANDIFNEALETYKNNFPGTVFLDNNDIRKIKNFPKADIVLGGFPCPGFSEAGPRLIDDKRNFLYLHFIRCLMQSKPMIFVAENVKGMMTLGKGEVFKQIVQDFAAAGYIVYYKLLNSAEYDVPQIRERVILVGIRDDLKYKFEFPSPINGNTDGLKPFPTLRDAIFDLRDDPGAYFIGSYSSIFMSRNRKKTWDDPSFTIQASGRQAPIHPDGDPMVKVANNKFIFSDGESNNRRLSCKEISRIQTFPDWYEFSMGSSDKKSFNAKLDVIYKQIGNAVPVNLAKAVGLSVAEIGYEFLKYHNRV